MRTLAVATFNVHCGVDGWGRPFDLEGACRILEADVIVLQEAWTPSKNPDAAQRLGEALGYDVVTQPFASGWLLQPSNDALARSSWGPDPWTRARTLRALKRRARAERAIAAAPGATTESARAAHVPNPFEDPPRFQPGTWDLWVLTRIPVATVEVLDLGKLRIDPVRRQAIMLTLSDSGRARPLTVVGTHMSHLTDGSPIQHRRLARSLPQHDVIVLGDMNMPGLILQAMFPGYRRVVRRPTWPARRPLIQSDHILATPGLAAGAQGEVVPAVRCSDHLPARARFVLD